MVLGIGWRKSLEGEIMEHYAELMQESMIQQIQGGNEDE